MNPFSLPLTDQFLYTMRESQREADRAITAEQRQVPVYMRRSKNQYTKLLELKNDLTPKSSSSYRSRRSQSYNRESIQELILRKREILLTKKKIEHKRASISFLENLNRSKEEEQKRTAREIEDSLVMFEKFEEKLKTEAKVKAELADRKNKQRLEKQAKILELEEEIDYFHGLYDRKVELLRHLTIYKNFVEELSSSDDLKKSTFVTSRAEPLSAVNLLKSINSLEQKNLFLIQQTQEAEISLDNLKSKSRNDFKSLSQELDEVKSNIRFMEKSKETIQSKLATIQCETDEDPLISQEAMSKIHEGLIGIFTLIGGDLATFPTDFEILELLENAIRSEIEKTKLMNEDELRTREKEVDKKRRVENVELIKLKEQMKAKEISETLQSRKRKVVLREGRKIMERSRLPDKVLAQKEVEIPQEVLDWKEFLDEDIPFG